MKGYTSVIFFNKHMCKIENYVLAPLNQIYYMHYADNCYAESAMKLISLSLYYLNIKLTIE